MKLELKAKWSEVFSYVHTAGNAQDRIEEKRMKIEWKVFI